MIDLPIEKRKRVEEDFAGSIEKAGVCVWLGARRDGDSEIDESLRYLRENVGTGILRIVRHGAWSVLSLLQ